MSEKLTVHTCPKCGRPATDLIEVDAGTRLLLQKIPGAGDLPARVCDACYNDLTGQVSQGVKLRLEAKAREKNRHMLWKSRVNLVKHARQMMNSKAYSDAAVSYEKYLRVLEISYDLKPGGLNPGLFGKSARSKELTVIATTYWDLMRIYDTHPKYRDRMQVATRKLAEFIPYSPMFPDVVKKAQDFASSARNPDLVKDFLKRSKAGGGRCFIATAAFENPYHPVVIDLQIFRDSVLMHSPLGRRFVEFYYRHSPRLANWLDQHSTFKRPTQQVLRLFARLVQ